MRTITIYDGGTGLFGPQISANDEELEAYEGVPFKEGAFNRMTHKVDLLTGEVVPYIPAPAPPMLHEIRNRRNDLLNDYRWTIMPDSPLTAECQAQWLAYLTSLHRLLLDYPGGVGLVWPELPGFQYPPAPSG